MSLGRQPGPAAVLVTAGVLTATSIVGLWQPHRVEVAAMLVVSLLATGLAYVAAGLAVWVPRRSEPVGSLVTTGGLLLVAAAASWWQAGALGYALAAAGALTALPLATVVFPDGTIPPVVGPIGIGVIVAAGGAAMVFRNDAVLFGAATTVLVTLVVVVWVRFDGAGERARTALLWLALGAVVTTVVGGQLTFVAPNIVGFTLALAVSLSLPAAVAVGVLRPDVADVRHLTVRCVVFLVAGMLLVALFSTAAGLLEVAAGSPPTTGAMAVLALLAAAGFQPTRVALQGVVDRVLFGDRADPVTAASLVGSQLSDDPVLALRALRESLALPYAALVSDGTLVASSGVRTTATMSVPLQIGAEVVGELIVGLRAGEAAVGRNDETVLRIVAPALAHALHARRLASDLLESRSAVISVVEEERRRLRRELHDGLGPTLTGVAYAADAARNLISADPQRADALLGALRSDTAHAITEIRRLVEGLRPPALDELGLVQALRQHTGRLFTADGRVLTVDVVAPEPLPQLPAAIEVAAYRIVVEAVTNVSKHAAGDRAGVRLDVVGSELTIEVRDNGPSTGKWSRGAGLTSMLERAQQVGGTCEAGSTDAGGCVRVTLPVVAYAAQRTTP